MGQVGVVGLGNMGSALAANLVAAGHDVVTHDTAGPDRSPEGATFAPDVGTLAATTDIAVFSLPDGRVSATVAAAFLEAADRRVHTIVDTSTVGPDASRTIASSLTEGGIAYIDAPVSGGPAGARARTLMIMYAGGQEACDAALPVLEGLSDRRLRVGDEPGTAQGVKLANNFLVANALAATSEAVAFATSLGLAMSTVLDVINVSSGRSAVSEDKFVNHVLTGTFASGFSNTLMAKDVRLYLDAVGSAGTPSTCGEVTAGIWERFEAARPGDDFTAVYTFTTDP